MYTSSPRAGGFARRPTVKPSAEQATTRIALRRERAPRRSVEDLAEKFIDDDLVLLSVMGDCQPQTNETACGTFEGILISSAISIPTKPR